MKSLLCSLVGSLFLLLLASAEPGLESESPESFVGCYFDEDLATQRATDEIEKAAENDEVSRFAVYLAFAWKKRDLDVTFAPGSDPKMVDKVAKIMVAWNEVCGIRLAKGVGAFESGDIRVAFKKDGGNHSKIGRNAARVSPSEPTMNLATCVNRPLDSQDFSRVVLHEFGHAIGFAHEHQHPLENCSDEIDWPRAYAFFARTQHWSKEQVDNNLQTLPASPGLVLSPKGDHDSVMRYFLDPTYLKAGRKSECFAEPTYRISPGDVKGALRLYPKENAGFGAGNAGRRLDQMISAGKLSAACQAAINAWKADWERSP